MNRQNQSLRDYDAFVGELEGCFSADGVEGGALAAGEIAALARLAEAIRLAVAAWAIPLRAMRLARTLDPGRAASLVAESVFDEVLIAPAWRVLVADLARAP